VVLGRSGAGKSTLLSLWGGMDEPEEGRVTVAGRDVRTLHGGERDHFLRRTVGWDSLI
jgi:putative ABC transport system ATP-binding protein